MDAVASGLSDPPALHEQVFVVIHAFGPVKKGFKDFLCISGSSDSPFDRVIGAGRSIAALRRGQ